MEPPRSAWGAFVCMGAGQAVSFLCSQMGRFAIGVVLYQQTRSATVYALITLANVTPRLAASTFAGIAVDRYARRRVLMIAQAWTGACSLVLAALMSRSAPLAPILAVIALSAVFSAALVPGTAAATSSLVSPRDLGRANGLLQVGDAVAQIAAPLAAAPLLRVLDIRGILLADAASSAVAVGALAAIDVPVPPAIVSGARRSPLREARAGYGYLASRGGLSGLLALLAVNTFGMSLIDTLLPPYVLAFSDLSGLARVASSGALGMLAGGIVMTLWGGPSRPIRTITMLVITQGILLSLGACPPSVPFVGVGALGIMFMFPIILSCNQVIWQNSVPNEMQGRVFAIRTMVAGAAVLLACLASGPLADRVFEPAMGATGLLAPTVGRILGVGPGRGVSLLFVVVGGALVASGLVAATFSPFRRLDERYELDRGAVWKT